MERSNLLIKMGFHKQAAVLGFERLMIRLATKYCNARRRTPLPTILKQAPFAIAVVVDGELISPIFSLPDSYNVAISGPAKHHDGSTRRIRGRRVCLRRAKSRQTSTPPGSLSTSHRRSVGRIEIAAFQRSITVATRCRSAHARIPDTRAARRKPFDFRRRCCDLPAGEAAVVALEHELSGCLSKMMMRSPSRAASAGGSCSARI